MKTLFRLLVLVGLGVMSLAPLHAMDDPHGEQARKKKLDDELFGAIQPARELQTPRVHVVESMLLDRGAEIGVRLEDLYTPRRDPSATIHPGGDGSTTYGQAHNGRMLLAQKVINLFRHPERIASADAFTVQQAGNLNKLLKAIEEGNFESELFASPTVVQAFLLLSKYKSEFFAVRRVIFTWALRNQYNHTLAVMLANGADPNVTDQEGGQTALHVAAMQGNVVAARMLLDYGAQLNVPRLDGLTPLDIARIHGDGSPMVRLLLAHGAAINAQQRADREQERRRQEGMTLLSYAILPETNLEIVQYLLNNNLPARLSPIKLS